MSLNKKMWDPLTCVGPHVILSPSFLPPPLSHISLPPLLSSLFFIRPRGAGVGAAVVMAVGQSGGCRREALEWRRRRAGEGRTTHHGHSPPRHRSRRRIPISRGATQSLTHSLAIYLISAQCSNSNGYHGAFLHSDGPRHHAQVPLQQPVVRP